MPKIVDHELRRQELSDATWRLIARDGVDAVTLRSIAAETGWSAGVLQHYFASKRDIVVSAHLLAYSRVAERLRLRASGLGPLEALRIAMDEALPLDDERLLEARVEISAWNLALSDDEFRRIHAESVAAWRATVRELARDARSAGELRSDISIDALTDEFVALVDAMSTQAVLTPEVATPQRQRELAELFFSRYVAP